MPAGRAVLAIAALALTAGCSGSAGRTAAPVPPTANDPCRVGRAAPEGASANVDYESFVRYRGVFYVHRTAASPAAPADIGPVIGHVTCHLDALDIDVRAPLRDGDASFAAKGAAIHAVRGYPHACRIAVRELGDMLVFSASVKETERLVPCRR